MDYNTDHYNPNGQGQQEGQDPNAEMQKPLTRHNPQFNPEQFVQMKNAAGNALSWFNQLTAYVEANPGIALGVGAALALMALSNMEQQNTGKDK